jgi:hypothetical protein
MNLLPRSATPQARRVLLARALRAFGDGYIAVLLAVYLEGLEFNAAAVGAISTSTLLGSACARWRWAYWPTGSRPGRA